MRSQPTGGAPATELLAAFEASGRRLVAALVEQLAAGQVEILHGLHTAGAVVGHRTAELTEAVAAMTETVEVEVAAGFERLLAEVLATIGERLHDEVEVSVGELGDAARHAADSIGAQLTASVQALEAARDDFLDELGQRLAARDLQLEARRAEEFARVLSDVLSRGGAKNRRLRDRVRRSLGETRREDEA
jgi:hypothetical protein